MKPITLPIRVYNSIGDLRRYLGECAALAQKRSKVDVAAVENLVETYVQAANADVASLMDNEQPPPSSSSSSQPQQLAIADEGSSPGAAMKQQQA
jgi:hypothetical protein